jgi:hypothetical protein
MSSNECVFQNNELQSIMTKTAVDQFKALSRHICASSEEIHVNISRDTRDSNEVQARSVKVESEGF